MAIMTANIIRGVACSNSLLKLSLFFIVETINRSRLNMRSPQIRPKKMEEYILSNTVKRA